jgi:DNA-binding beta-propeller fold protein YncE
MYNRLTRRSLFAAAPTLLIAGRSKSVVLGSGSHKYEVAEGWGRLPEGVRYGYTHGVAVDSQQRIIIHNQSKDSVILFDRKGKFIKSWGPEFEKGAHGLTLHREGGTDYVYLADYARHIVVKATVDGETVWTLRYPQEPDVYSSEDQYKPTNVAVASNGDVYVADGYGLSWIHQYDSKARYIRSWGGKGKDAGQLDCPHGIWVDTRGANPVLTVADRSNQRLQLFTMDGKHAGFVNDELRRPCHFDQYKDELYIPDLWGRVTIFDKNNRLITHLGDNPEVWKAKGYPNLPQEQRIQGKFISPHSAAVDSDGNIYVVEWISDGRVTKLRRV